MRALPFTVSFLFICLLGCTAPSLRRHTAKSFDILNPVSAQELEQAKQKLHLLRADMSDEQIFTVLGLSRYYGRYLAHAGGPTFCLWISYTLRNGHDLHLVFSASGLLILATLDDATWKGDYHPIRDRLLVPDQVDQLATKLSSDGMWSSGYFLPIDLPSSASPETLISQVFQKKIFDQWARVTTYQIIRFRQVQIRSSIGDKNYTAVLVDTNLGRKIVLLQYVGSIARWWNRVYDAAPSA